jgi:hypothetical protein
MRHVGEERRLVTAGGERLVAGGGQLLVRLLKLGRACACLGLEQALLLAQSLVARLQPHRGRAEVRRLCEGPLTPPGAETPVGCRMRDRPISARTQVKGDQAVG